MSCLQGAAAGVLQLEQVRHVVMFGWSDAEWRLVQVHLHPQSAVPTGARPQKCCCLQTLYA